MAKAYTLFLMGVGLIVFGLMNMIYLRYNKNNSVHNEPDVEIRLNQIEEQVQLRSVIPSPAEEINTEGIIQNKEQKHQEKAHAKNKKSHKHAAAGNVKESNTTIEVNKTQEKVPVTTSNATVAQTSEADVIITPGPGEPTIPVSDANDVKIPQTTLEISVKQALQEIQKQKEIEEKADAMIHPVPNAPISKPNPDVDNNPLAPPTDSASPRNETVSPTTVNPNEGTITTSPIPEYPTNETQTQTTPVKEDEAKPKKEKKKTKKKVHKKKEKSQTGTDREISALFENEILDSDESTQDDEYEPEILDIDNDEDERTEEPHNTPMIQKKAQMLLENTLAGAVQGQDPVMEKAKIVSEVNKSSMTVIVLLLLSFMLISIALIIAEVYSNYKKRNTAQELTYDYMLLDEGHEVADNSIKSRNIRDI